MELYMENELTEQLRQTDCVFTHGGKFHADDVFSYALLRMIHPGLLVRRGNEVPQDFIGIVFDIGGGAFDHHGNDEKKRENGVPYAAFGLLWQQLGTAVLGDEKQAEKFDFRFVQPLDQNDNTGEPDEIASLIADFNPVWDADEDTDAAFLRAADFAEQILERKFSCIKSNIRADEAVKPYLAQASDGILVMDQYLPWKKAVEKEEGIAFVVFPSNRGGYCAMSVKDPVLKETKCPFPAEWYGKRDKELAEISGIASLRFCHKTGFMLTADEKEDAILACRVSREKEKKSRIFWMRVKKAFRKKKSRRDVR